MMALPAAIAGDVDPLSTRDLDALKPLTGAEQRQQQPRQSQSL